MKFIYDWRDILGMMSDDLAHELRYNRTLGDALVGLGLVSMLTAAVFATKGRYRVALGVLSWLMGLALWAFVRGLRRWIASAKERSVQRRARVVRAGWKVVEGGRQGPPGAA